MMNAMRPFAGDVTFPKSVCNALIDGMSPDLLRVFRTHYPNHSLLHDTSSTFQFSRFKPILDAMTAAEEEVANITAIVRQSVGGQALLLLSPPLRVRLSERSTATPQEATLRSAAIVRTAGVRNLPAGPVVN